MFIKTTSIFILGLLFLSCAKAPDYSVEPYIKFLSIERIQKSSNQDALNDLKIGIKFEDGDGDIGITQADSLNPKFKAYFKEIVFRSDTGDVIKYKFYNYCMDLYIKKNGIYKKVVPDLPFGGTLEPLISYNEIGPIDGELFLEQTISKSRPLGFVGNDTIRFEIFIVDRAPHKSNTILTDDIIVFSK